MYADVLLQRVVSEYFVDPVAEVSENGHSAVQRKTFGLDSQCASFGGGKVTGGGGGGGSTGGGDSE